MTDAEKLTSIKTMLEITGTDQDTQLNAYLDLAEAEILGWLGVEEVPDRYAATHVMAVVAGYNMIGAEGQISHAENGISRQWKHADMVDYIRAHCIPMAQVY